GPCGRHCARELRDGRLAQLAQRLRKPHREVLVGETRDPALARQRAEAVEGKDAVHVLVDAAVVVMRIVDGELGGGKARVDAPERVVAFDVERRVALRAHARGAHQADEGLLQLAPEGGEGHAIPGQLERLLHRYLNLSSASMILSVGGCWAMSWMSM